VMQVWRSTRMVSHAVGICNAWQNLIALDGRIPTSSTKNVVVQIEAAWCRALAASMRCCSSGITDLGMVTARPFSRCPRPDLECRRYWRARLASSGDASPARPWPRCRHPASASQLVGECGVGRLDNHHPGALMPEEALQSIGAKCNFYTESSEHISG
jgi:hypothetical protein